MEKKTKETKPDYDRLSEKVQVLLKPSEYKNMERLRRESSFPSDAAYLRALILDNLKHKRQLELF